MPEIATQKLPELINRAVWLPLDDDFEPYWFQDVSK